jgi:hypothetical protein
MDNIRIRRARFLNQNSLFGLDLEKVFFAAEPKIVLQQNRPTADSNESLYSITSSAPASRPAGTSSPSFAVMHSTVSCSKWVEVMIPPPTARFLSIPLVQKSARSARPSRFVYLRRPVLASRRRNTLAKQAAKSEPRRVRRRCLTSANRKSN